MSIFLFLAFEGLEVALFQKPCVPFLLVCHIGGGLWGLFYYPVYSFRVFQLLDEICERSKEGVKVDCLTEDFIAACS